MPLYGLQNGVFAQGQFPNDALATGAGMLGNSPGDSAFLGSKFHQRGRPSLATAFSFPTAKYNPSGQGWNIRIDLTSPTLTPYQNGAYVAIDFRNGLTVQKDGTYFDNGSSGTLGYSCFMLNPSTNIFSGGAFYDFSGGAWIPLTYAQYYGAAAFAALGGTQPNWMVMVAKWGHNGFKIRAASPLIPALYRGGNFNTVTGLWGILSELEWLTPPVAPSKVPGYVNIINTIALNVNFQIVSADFSQVIDITPAGGFTGTGQGLVNMTSFNTSLLFGNNTTWYPQIIFSAVADPGFATSYLENGLVLNSVYGVCWTNLSGSF
jgi:hypothetical protein